MTLILSRYSGERVAVDSFAAFTALVALLQFALRRDASHDWRLIDPGADPHRIAVRGFYGLLLVVIFSASIAVAFWSPLAAEITWALTFVIFSLAHPTPGGLRGPSASSPRNQLANQPLARDAAPG
jgi:hypothetical protein